MWVRIVTWGATGEAPTSAHLEAQKYAPHKRTSRGRVPSALEGAPGTLLLRGQGADHVAGGVRRLELVVHLHDHLHRAVAEELHHLGGADVLPEHVSAVGVPEDVRPNPRGV